MGGLKGCLAALTGNRPFSAFVALFALFRRAPGKSRERRKQGLFPQISSVLLKPPSLKSPFAATQGLTQEFHGPSCLQPRKSPKRVSLPWGRRPQGDQESEKSAPIYITYLYHLSISPIYIYLFIYLSFYLCICLSVYLSISNSLMGSFGKGSMGSLQKIVRKFLWNFRKLSAEFLHPFLTQSSVLFFKFPRIIWRISANFPQKPLR